MSEHKSENTDFIFRRYKRKKNSTEIMDAHDYGYQAWKIPKRKGK